MNFALSSPEFSVPSWVSTAIFYQIFPDRFRRSTGFANPGMLQPWGTEPTAHNFMGGNLRGILEGLDHIQELGATALYLCPIFSSTSNHRYHTNDYFRIDPLLGDDREFDALVAAVHARGMKIILDGVFNHCSRGFYPFHSLLECGEESPFRDWFHIDSFPINAHGPGPANYRCWWNIPALPKFNTQNAEVREFLWSVGEYWIKRGADGWRLDVPNEIDDDSFWRTFRIRVKRANPEAYIVGEIWGEPTRWLQGDQFDGVMNYPARRAILESLFPDAMAHPENLSTGEPAVHKQSTTSWGESLCAKLQATFPEHPFGVPLNLLGSHDNIRLASLGVSSVPKQMQAWALLFFLPGTPSIYAGDELGQEGGKDPDNRRCFPWDSLESLRHKSAWKTLRQLIEMRKENAVLRSGSFHCCTEGKMVLVTRELDGLRIKLRIHPDGTWSIE
jgi:glycosidase